MPFARTSVCGGAGSPTAELMCSPHLHPLGHWTLAVTAASALMVKVQVFVLLPPLEHAPDHTTSRPLDTRRVIAVPVGNDAVPAAKPVLTLMPTGAETTVSPAADRSQPGQRQKLWWWWRCRGDSGGRGDRDAW